MAAAIMCARCGSADVVPDADVRREYGVARGIVVRAKADPQRALLTVAATALLRARVCVACGHVELYVTDLAAMRGVLEERAKRETSS